MDPGSVHSLDLFSQVKSAEHIAKFNTCSIHLK